VGSTVFESAVFSDMFGTAEMRAVFADEALIDRYLDLEVALARAQARSGVVPQTAADEIDAAARSIKVDFGKLRQEAEIVGYPILPPVHQLSEAAGEAGRYVHWGATTQDIMGTANVLQLRAALQIIARDLHELREILAMMARKHRDTAMAGRAHLQHTDDVLDALGGPDAVRSHCDPMNYVGLAPQMVDSVLARPNRN
jgi:3-carboxy-cis,cis-muconate cycloisomerase